MTRPTALLLAFALIVPSLKADETDGELPEAVADEVPTYRIFLDPGHGGRPENASRVGGAHWDPLQGKFLNVYRYGSEWRAKKADGGKVVAEQEQVLKLAKLVRKRLDWTRTPEGWKKFEGLLSRYGSVLPPFHRVRFETRLSRENDFRTHPTAKTKKGRRRVNKYFRIFDCPDSYPHKAGGPMRNGRLSDSAAFSPHFQVSMHIDGSVNPKQRGMSALFVPSPASFEAGRQILLKQGKADAIPKKLRRWWSYRGRRRTKLGWLLNDTWTYFTGYGPAKDIRKVRKKSYIGQRWQHVTWAYADEVEAEPVTVLKGPFTGPFFEREASPQEAARRQGGIEEVGGDNLYAGQELLRYIRMAWWKHHAGGAKAWAEKLEPKQLLPPLEHPTGADWAMPLFTNAVAPYLELGQLWNEKDRYLLTEWLEPAADGMAVGIYSLTVGFQVPPVGGVEIPKGKAIDWSRYRMPDGKTYFEASHPRYRRRQIAGPAAEGGEEGKGS